MLFVELMGMPRAGKSTVANAVALYLQCSGLKVGRISDRETAKMLPLHMMEPRDISLAMCAEMMSKCLHSQCDVMLMDRGFHDMAAWLAVNGADPWIASALKKVACRDGDYLVVRFDLDADASIERHRRGDEHDKVDDGVMDNPKLLGELSTVYRCAAADIIVDGRMPSIAQKSLVVSAVKRFVWSETRGGTVFIRGTRLTPEYVQSAVMAGNRYFLTEYLTDDQINGAISLLDVP